MDTEKITKSSKIIVVILSSVLLLFTKVYGVAPKSRETRSSSKNQTSRIPKTAYKQPAKQSIPVAKKPTASPSSFKPDMSFGEAIDILRNSTVPPLNIAVLWRDLQENADIYKETPIGMNGLSGVPLRTHLKVLLMSVSGASVEKLRYTVEDGVIIIATESSLPRKIVTRIYDISDLASEPANYRLMPGFGMLFGFGGMSYGGMTPLGGTGFLGQGFLGSGNIGSYGGFNSTIRADR